jgi:di/tricarboxylate transporter
MKKVFATVFSILCALMTHSSVLACAVCFNPDDYKTTNAINKSILFMIGVTAVVLVGITWMVVRSIRAAQRRQVQ